MQRASICFVAAAVAVLGCQSDQPLSSRPASPGADISDGAHEAPGFPSNPHFFFLRPMVAAPSPGGVFNPRLSPVVQICSQTATPCPAEQVHAVFTTAGDSAAIRVDTSRQRYAVN